MTSVAYMDPNDLVADSIEADWGHMRHANKTLARLADINESTLKGIRQKKHTPSLRTTFQLAPHVPTLRANLAKVFGFDSSASSEAKRIQAAMAALRGDYDATIQTIQGVRTGLPSMEGVQRGH